MALKTAELISIVLAALVTGVFWGPWIGLTRSMSTFTPDVFLAIVQRMNRNIGPLMTVLMPVALLSMIPVLFLSYHARQGAFYFTLASLGLFIVALLVTVLIEVPLVQQFETWTESTLPDNWQELRDRWGSNHLTRVASGIAGLALLVAGAIS